MSAHVVAVAARGGHGIGKILLPSIRLIANLGVEGDAHCGATVQHRSRVAKNPVQPNLRQVHLIQAELFEELASNGFAIAPGEMGENATTRGIDLLALPEGAVLSLGPEAQVAITGLRNPCHQLNEHTPGLMNAVLDRASDGSLVRKAGVMAIVLAGGVVRAGDDIRVEMLPDVHRALQPV